MIAAERSRSYEYQRDYKTERQRERRTNVQRTPKRQVEKQTTTVVITAREKAMVLMMIVLAGVVCIGLIVTSAYAAKVKYNINTLERKKAVIVGEIENLNVKIQNGTNLNTIEERAIVELGMVYPTTIEQVVYINEDAEVSEDLAVALKEQAYNSYN